VAGREGKGGGRRQKRRPSLGNAVLCDGRRARRWRPLENPPVRVAGLRRRAAGSSDGRPSVEGHNTGGCHTLAAAHGGSESSRDTHRGLAPVAQRHLRWAPACELPVPNPSCLRRPVGSGALVVDAVRCPTAGSQQAAAYAVHLIAGSTTSPFFPRIARTRSLKTGAASYTKFSSVSSYPVQKTRCGVVTTRLGRDQELYEVCSSSYQCDLIH